MSEKDKNSSKQKEDNYLKINIDDLNSGPFFTAGEAASFVVTRPVYEALNISSDSLSSNQSFSFSLNPTVFKSTQQLEDEINTLKKEQYDLIEKLKKVKKESATFRNNNEQLEKVTKDLNQKLKLGNLLNQVNSAAQVKLFENQDFRELFETTSECKAYVVAIDIRRSTELMLKAKTPQLFQKFIISLCGGLRKIILDNYGVFDKFTGDGVLAFFPDFYSGKDANLLAVKSSIECHEFFTDFYKKNRNCFTSVIQDIGLGIGIDCGKACLVNMEGSYTVVGNPVVYACRFSCAKAGDTLLNQTAYEEISNAYRQYFNFDETEVEIKHEGNFLAYRVCSNGEKINYNKPDWDK